MKTQLDFGPRIPGTEGHRRTGDCVPASAVGRDVPDQGRAGGEALGQAGGDSVRDLVSAEAAA